MSGTLRIGNCSGFYGDRISAMQEMLTGGDLDVLTGDYLAELTMLILAKDRHKDPGTGYAKTFLVQMQQCLALAKEKNVTIVANAGGLNPAGLAQKLQEIAQEAQIDTTIVYIDGDDITASAAEYGLGNPLAANAYLGAFGIARACAAGADIVVTGRVTDASVVIGPAIAHFDWARDDYDALAGATVAGHIIECGTQATGGNMAFFTEIPDMIHPGFPIAEISADGSCVITKHEGTSGAVTVDTVTAQLLYEISSARYAGPDVVTRLDTVRLKQIGPDRVQCTGTIGEPPPPEVKVSCTALGGYLNEISVVLTGLDIPAKAELLKSQIIAALKHPPASLEWHLARTDHPNASTQAAASATLTVRGRDANPKTVGRALTSTVVEYALASFPGFFALTPPGNAKPYGVFTPGFIPQNAATHRVNFPDGSQELIDAPTHTIPLEDRPDTSHLDKAIPPRQPEKPVSSPADSMEIPLGRFIGARSGDKGGNANLGLWARTPAAYEWLTRELTPAKLQELLPETADLLVERFDFPLIYGINFIVHGLLGQGVASNARFDPQAKALGEWVRSRTVTVPASITTAPLSPTEKV